MHRGIDSGSLLVQLLLLLVLGPLACAADPAPGPPFPELVADQSFPGEPADPEAFDGLFRTESSSPPCRVENATDLQASMELRVFHGSETKPEDLEEFLGALQRYYAQYGVAFFVRHQPIGLPFQSAIAFDRKALTARVRDETGIDLDDESSTLSAEQRAAALLSLGRAFLHNVRELLRVYAVPRRGGVFNVVLLPRMLDEPTPELGALETMAGLGLSPEMLVDVAADDPSADLYEWLDVRHGDFTPTAIVGIEPTRQYLAAPDVLISHEVAHAYGLNHVWLMGNLMHPSEFDCRASLADDQLHHIAGAEPPPSAEARFEYAIHPPSSTPCVSSGAIARAVRAFRWPALP
jgi:hypothetical protein